MAVPAVLRFSPLACSSNTTRRSSILILRTSSACAADTAVSRRSAESNARSASSLVKVSWCAHLLRESRSSLIRLRSDLPRVLRKTSFHVSHMIFSWAAASQSVMGLFASSGSSMKPFTTWGDKLPTLTALLISRSTNGPSPAFSNSIALPTRSWFVVAIAYSCPNRSSVPAACEAGPFARQTRNFRPALHQPVIRKRFGRTLLALAERVKPIRQLTGHLGLGAKLLLALLPQPSPPAFKRTDQLVHHLPRCQARVRRWVPVPGRSSGFRSRTFPRLDPGFLRPPFRQRSYSWPLKAFRLRRTRPLQIQTVRTRLAPTELSASKSPSCSASASSRV